MNKHFSGRKKFILLPLIGIALVSLFGWIVMMLWNAILPSLITGVGVLTFPKAIGLLILCKILFGGFKGQGGKPNFKNGFAMRKKMMNMSDEEKEKFQEEWRQRCGGKND